MPSELPEQREGKGNEEIVRKLEEGISDLEVNSGAVRAMNKFLTIEDDLNSVDGEISAGFQQTFSNHPDVKLYKDLQLLLKNCKRSLDL
jgi:hypothetical protein